MQTPHHPTTDRSARSPDAVQADIEAVLDDTTLPVGERQLRLQSLARELGVEIDPAGASDIEPDMIRTQIFNALGLVAQGGHDYAGSEEGAAVEPLPGPGSPSTGD